MQLLIVDGIKKFYNLKSEVIYKINNSEMKYSNNLTLINKLTKLYT